MNILNILNNKELSDIPILYILRIIGAIQKEIFKKHLETLKNITQPNII